MIIVKKEYKIRILSSCFKVSDELNDKNLLRIFLN